MKGRSFWKVLFLLFAFVLSSSAILAQKKFIYVDNGRLYNPDGKEVALWGVNFQPNLSWEYNSRIRRVGIPLEADALKKNADEGFDEIQKMKAGVIRCHLTPADFTDENGNLVQTVYLDMLDYMVSEAGKRGIYVYLAFLNHMNNGQVKNSFMNTCKRIDWIYNPDIVRCSQNYMKQLLERKNPYTGLTYKNDPTIAVWELINEPSYFQYEEFVKSKYYDAFRKWLAQNTKEDSRESYLQYRKQLVKNYINGMHDLIRSTGAPQPVVWCCNWHKFYNGRQDVFEAVAESKAEVVSICNYPGQNECKQPYGENPQDFLNYDFTSWFKDAYERKDWYGWLLEPGFMKKAKVVYEFETFYNMGSYLYPAMADLYRSLGVQMAAMWTYCFPSYAKLHSGSHFLSLTCTPRKAASFLVAGELFRSTPLYSKFETNSPVEKATADFAYSYKNNLSAYSANGKYVHTGDMMNWNAIAPDPDLQEITGYGSSPLVSYNGTGIYFLKISGKEILLSIEPNSKWIVEPWQQWRYRQPVTDLDYVTPHDFELKLEKLNPAKCKVYRIENGNNIPVRLKENKIKFDAMPGEYLITKK